MPAAVCHRYTRQPQGKNLVLSTDRYCNTDSEFEKTFSEDQKENKMVCKNEIFIYCLYANALILLFVKWSLKSLKIKIEWISDCIAIVLYFLRIIFWLIFVWVGSFINVTL